MNTFILKQTRDGIHHLYLDNPDKEGFIKVGQAPRAKFIREHTHVILYDGISKNKTLYGIMHEEVFQVTLPENSQISFINDYYQNCIFEQNGQWYTMQFDRGSWQKLMLGDMYIVNVSTYDVIQYRLDAIYWQYFLLKKDTNIEIRHFVENKLVFIGTYLEIIETRCAKLIAFKTAGEFDVITPVSKTPLQGKEGDMFEALDGVFVWFEPEKKWIFHLGCTSWGKNAVFRTSGNKYVKLYKIEGKFIRFIAEGRWKWMEGISVMCIEGIKYAIDSETHLVDFDNPKPTFRKKILNFFKRK